jgi:L-ascorbate metabolism protein UlaG (beta-lactamase superfamily)
MQRRTVLAGLAAAPLLAALPARAQAKSETLATSAGDVTITPVKHASLVLGFGNEVIYVDPSGADFSALPPATAILITHAHGDHFDPATLEKVAGDTAPILTTEEVQGKLADALKARSTVLRNGESGTLNGIAIEAVAAYNTTPERQKYHPQGVGNGYVLSFGDKRVYVAGDTEPTPEMLALKDIAVAFLPCNLPYTMTVDQLAEAIKTFRPAVTYPYHYGDTDLSGLPGMVGDASDVRLLNWYPA